jgi:CheY-like chemotaxis protein
VLRALLVTPDSALAGTFTELSRELGIEAQPCTGTNSIHDELQRTKYEAVLIDFDKIPDASTILVALRRSPAAKTSVIFAVASDPVQGRSALQDGASLLFERPLGPGKIRHALHAAYDLMARERRRYFRCASKFPVLLITANSQADYRCTSINVSSGGIAVMSPVALASGDQVQIVFLLPGMDGLTRAIGTVIWDDKHGKTGLSFKCTDPEYQSGLDSWLDNQLVNTTATPKTENGAAT